MIEEFYDECCGASKTYEHGDDCPLHFNRKTWLDANDRAVKLIVERIAEEIEEVFGDLG